MARDAALGTVAHARRRASALAASHQPARTPRSTPAREVGLWMRRPRVRRSTSRGRVSGGAARGAARAGRAGCLREGALPRYGAAVTDETETDGIEGARGVCRLCGAPLPLDDWIGLEISREGLLVTGERTDVESLNAVFCSQEHAATFLTQPLPPLQPRPPAPPRSTLRETFELTALIAGGVVTIGLIGIGVSTVVQWFAGG